MEFWNWCEELPEERRKGKRITKEKKILIKIATFGKFFHLNMPPHLSN